jgi:hypothetical protein
MIKICEISPFLAGWQMPIFQNGLHSTAPGMAVDVFCHKNVSYLN